jgi:hypothetical protein
LHYIFAYMLSEIIKRKIEEKAGQRIRYSRDCETLADKILSECKCGISSSTLRRLFGFSKSNKQPRIYTLDILANYLNYGTWDELLASLNNKASANKEIRELKPNSLKKGQKFELTYKPDTELIIEYIGKYQFKVISVKNSRLKPGEVFKTSIIMLHHPLFILDIEGSTGIEGRIIEGKISGITSIKKI